MDRTADLALRMLDELLAERPDKVGHDFSEATRCIAAYRDELTSIWRRTESKTDLQRLAAINAVLSVVLGAHYPLGTIPWPLLEKARAQLATVAAR